MDAFFLRKKRHRISSSPEPPVDGDQGTSGEESTEYKLTLLTSLHPHLEPSALLDILISHGGSVSLASSSLTGSAPQSSSTTIGYQSSLSSYVKTESASPKRAKLLCSKGKTLHLYSPEDVAAHTPCTVIHNFLPAQEADGLLMELLVEAESFSRNTFRLFDNIVTSPHTACFYVDGYEEVVRQKTEYFYNGEPLADVRELTTQMRQVSPKVTTMVNMEITHRIATHHNERKLCYQSPHPWKPNVAFVNCYSGPRESVGYHSDQLTYLGPRATIASLSLGVAREFRVRKIFPRESDFAKIKEVSDAEGQIAIHLPHNSLLIMHAEMQEEWKHSIAPATAIDLHPLSGSKRINITYRNYRPSLHPKFTPRCHCSVPTVLRVVQRKKENWGRYFWMCHAGNVPGKDGCDFFQWAEFDDDGEPIWKKFSDLGREHEIKTPETI